MMQSGQIQRFPWGTVEEAQVLIVHFGSKSTPMIAQQLRQIGLQSRVIHAAGDNDEIVTLPPGWQVMASTAQCRHALVGVDGVSMDDGTRFVRVFVEVTGKPPSTTEPH